MFEKEILNLSTMTCESVIMVSLNFKIISTSLLFSVAMIIYDGPCLFYICFILVKQPKIICTFCRMSIFPMYTFTCF